MEWNHGLDIEEIYLVIVLWTGREVEVVLERYTDEIRYRILRLLHQFFFTRFMRARLL